MIVCVLTAPCYSSRLLSAGPSVWSSGKSPAWRNSLTKASPMSRCWNLSWMEVIWISLKTVQRNCKSRNGCAFKRHCILHTCLFCMSCLHECLCLCILFYMHSYVCISCLPVCLFLHIMFTWMSAGVCNNVYTSMLVFAHHICNVCCVLHLMCSHACLWWYIVCLYECLWRRVMCELHILFLYDSCVYISYLWKRTGELGGDLCLTLYSLHT